jgi:hypothetical protein
MNLLGYGPLWVDLDDDAAAVNDRSMYTAPHQSTHHTVDATSSSFVKHLSFPLSLGKHTTGSTVEPFGPCKVGSSQLVSAMSLLGVASALGIFEKIEQGTMFPT